MKNVKDQVYAGLTEKFDNVSDEYPDEWARYPIIQYTEEDNKVYEHSDKEDKAYVRYRVDIWNDRSTSQNALEVDEVMAKLGLVRTLCQDANMPGVKHKVMRYEGIIDMYSEEVYWPN